jgi:hypothetical protein
MYKELRSFTIETVTLRGNTRSSPRFAGGRFISSTPSSAAKKAFSQIYRELGRPKNLSIVIEIRETTRNSKKKLYKYRVTKKSSAQKLVERDGEIITYEYTTSIKSLK